MPSAKLLKLFHSTEQNGRHMIAKTRNICKRHLYLGHWPQIIIILQKKSQKGHQS